MANNPGAKKAIRKIAARTEVNKARRTRVRTFLRKFQDALTAGDAAAAAYLSRPLCHPAVASRLPESPAVPRPHHRGRRPRRHHPGQVGDCGRASDLRVAPLARRGLLQVVGPAV